MRDCFSWRKRRGRKMRLTFSEDEFYQYFEVLKKADIDLANDFLNKKIKYGESKTAKKTEAAKAATEARTAAAKKKIENAMNLLRIENKKINYNTIAKKAGVSYLTAKKYVTL